MKNNINVIGLAITAFSLSATGAELLDVESLNLSRGKVSELNRIMNLGNMSALKNMTVQELPDGRLKRRLIQTFADVDVKSSYITLTLDNNNQEYFIEASGSVYKGLSQDLDELSENMSEVRVKELISERRKLNEMQKRSLKSELLIETNEYDKAQYIYQLSYLKVENRRVSRPFIVVDAKTGQFIREWDGAHQLKTPALAHGIGGNEKTHAYHYGVDFDPMKISKDGNVCSLENNQVVTVDMRHSWNLERPQSAFTYECEGQENKNDARYVNGSFSALNDAHYFGSVIYDLYQSWANTTPLNSKLKMRVHFGQKFENAFWDGEAMTFGDGDVDFYPLVDINVSTHEVSHGFTEQNSNLEYSNQSGGINESFSDIAGEAAEYFVRGEVDWVVGADIFKGQGGLRYFDDPTKDGRSIGHTKDYYDGLNVHWSSGIFNKAFYLLVHKHKWDVKTAFQAFTLANQLYWHETSTFDHAACGVKRAAKDLRQDQRDIVDAFYSVGVNAICSMPPEITKLSVGQTLENISGKKNQDYYYAVQVPAGKSKLTIKLEHSDYDSSNDADLYVSNGEKPTSMDAQCQSREDGSVDSCVFNRPDQGIYLILVKGYFDFRNYSLTATVN